MPVDMKTAVEELKKVRGAQNAAWAVVIEAARAFAEMKAHGTYIADGRCVGVALRDQPRYLELFNANLLTAVQQAYAEDARAGASFSNLT